MGLGIFGETHQYHGFGFFGNLSISWVWVFLVKPTNIVGLAFCGKTHGKINKNNNTHQYHGFGYSGNPPISWV